jgi:alkylation response protein AidB-like acyl-CoA dehydrogenase
VQTFTAQLIPWPENSASLRREVRELIASHPIDPDPAKRLNSWTVADPAFSELLGRAGFIGMTWPREYGGHERSSLERYIVLEELLAAGAPVASHWMADRQTGGMLLRYGTEQAKRKWVAGMAKGKVFACIGLSEPNSGSDLASVRTAARRRGDRWVIDGQKVWTTGAHFAHVMIALVRTAPNSERQDGLSQFLIPMNTPGVTVKPIVDIAGVHDFNEVFFDSVELDESALVGTEGEGWQQANAELAMERSGPERYLSSTALFLELLRHVGPSPDEQLKLLVGRLTAEMWTLRMMSATVAAKLAAGEDAVLESMMVKDLGTNFEQALPELVQAAVDIDLAGASRLARVLGHLLQIAPSFSLRGGTREIVRGIIARGLGLR